jgi:hypothetical protein
VRRAPADRNTKESGEAAPFAVLPSPATPTEGRARRAVASRFIAAPRERKADARTPEGLRVQTRRRTLGNQVVCRRWHPLPQEPVSVEVRGAQLLPEHNRARASGRAARAPRADARRACRAVPGAPRGHRPTAHDPGTPQAAALRHRGVRRRAPARPGAHERRDRLLEGHPARALPLRRYAGAPPDPGGGRALGLHGPQSGPPWPAAIRNHRRGRFASTRARSSTQSPPSYRRPIELCQCSAPRPD